MLLLLLLTMTTRPLPTEMLLNGVEQNNRNVFSPKLNLNYKEIPPSKEEITTEKHKSMKVNTLLNVRKLSAVCFNETAYSPYPPCP